MDDDASREMYVVLLLFEVTQLDNEKICNDQMWINVTNEMRLIDME